MRSPDPKPSKARLGSLRALFPFMRRHSTLLVSALLALIVSSSASLSMPLAIKVMIDEGFKRGSGSDIDRAFLLMFLVVTVLALSTAARFFFITMLGERVVADLRGKLYAHLIGLDSGFHERNRSGELVSRLTADVELIRSVVGSAMSVALRSTITVIGALTMLLVTSPRLAAWTLIGIPLAIMPMVIAGRRLHNMSRDTQDRVADANTLASETLGAVRTVQAYARESYERERFESAVDITVRAARNRIGWQSIMTATIIMLFFGAITLVLWSGAHDVLSGKMTPGTLIQFVLYAVFAGGSVAALTEVWNEVQRAAGGMSRIGELLQEPPGIVAPERPKPLPEQMRGDIALEHVNFHYPMRKDAAALEDFTLRIRSGETVALVGPSGAGKSTVLSLLLRFHDPQQGRVAIDGIDLRDCDPVALRSRIALVPQQPTLFAASARDNIRYGRLEASDEEIDTAAKSAEAHEFLSALPHGYEEQLGERGVRLSGGQQQRIAIARALLKNAPVLLLDEATSALDAQSERAVQHALENLMRGRTTLVIAHRLATVLKADRIVVMDKGRIVAEGTHEALLAQDGLYAELARLQFLD